MSYATEDSNLTEYSQRKQGISRTPYQRFAIRKRHICPSIIKQNILNHV